MTSLGALWTGKRDFPGLIVELAVTPPHHISGSLWSHYTLIPPLHSLERIVSFKKTRVRRTPGRVKPTSVLLAINYISRKAG